MGKNLIFLGIGIIITSLFWTNQTLSEQEIISKAKEMGMVFQSELEKELYQKIEKKIRLEIEQEKPDEILLSIPKGVSGQYIATLLNERGFDGQQFLMEIEKRGFTSKIKHGNFLIKSDASIDEIISLLTN
ncbi:hypothetical protein SAMN02745227_00111 [Anaerobranca californiensis DSM 14826]|jgi:cell division protein YceG involved in septum cleavage|uniref:YceG-like family protein n=1 Tax=Anaerobranca californiensis DSM 14826 TaxID=1120989 RepID=A0A1M6KGE6_9FIRM|nr:hypothetical protein [Anaerobranca californiensis]SHJ58015.1 hypothetical protein SAMN02745227_00111 [Anaerobranca californiensis DSM 14826]